MILPPALFQNAFIWAPIGIALCDALWTDIHTGLIYNRAPCLILFWCMVMHYRGNIHLFFLSTVIIGLLLLALYGFFWRRHGKSVMGGGDFKLIMACSFMIHPLSLGQWMAFIGIGSLVTNAMYGSTKIPMAPAIGLSFALTVFLKSA